MLDVLAHINPRLKPLRHDVDSVLGLLQPQHSQHSSPHAFFICTFCSLNSWEWMDKSPTEIQRSNTVGTRHIVPAAVVAKEPRGLILAKIHNKGRPGIFWNVQTFLRTWRNKGRHGETSARDNDGHCSGNHSSRGAGTGDYWPTHFQRQRSCFVGQLWKTRSLGLNRWAVWGRNRGCLEIRVVGECCEITCQTY